MRHCVCPLVDRIMTLSKHHYSEHFIMFLITFFLPETIHITFHYLSLKLIVGDNKRYLVENNVHVWRGGINHVSKCTQVFPDMHELKVNSLVKSQRKEKREEKEEKKTTFSTKGINCWYSASVFSSSMMKGR